MAKRRRSSRTRGAAQTTDRSLPRGIADRLILEQSDRILAGSALLIMLNGTALAAHLTRVRPDVAWNIFTFEHYYLTAAVNALNDAEGVDDKTQIELFCTPDLPDESFDTIVLATDSRGNTELLRDVLQQASHRLQPDGRLVISTNNPRDHWLQDHLKKTYGKVTAVKETGGVCYIARKRPTPIKQKDFDCEFAFRDEDTLIQCFSRPGVFSHRRIDGGARALIRSLDLPVALKSPPQSIVEVGCGAGTVSVAAALRNPDSQIIAIDSHARAVQSTEQTAALNQVTNVVTQLTSTGDVPGPGSHDLFLCNPPYYSDYQISELFLQSAAHALRRGGRLHVVTKQIEWHHNRVLEIFANVQVEKIGDYHIVLARQL